MDLKAMTQKLPRLVPGRDDDQQWSWRHVSLVVGLGLGLVGIVSKFWPWSWFQGSTGEASTGPKQAKWEGLGGRVVAPASNSPLPVCHGHLCTSSKMERNSLAYLKPVLCKDH